VEAATEAEARFMIEQANLIEAEVELEVTSVRGSRFSARTRRSRGVVYLNQRLFYRVKYWSQNLKLLWVLM